MLSLWSSAIPATSTSRRFPSHLPTSQDIQRITPIETSSPLNPQASCEDKRLHGLSHVCNIESEAYRRAAHNTNTFADTEQYVLNMRDTMWISMQALLAHLGEDLNQCAAIARLPDEILGRVFEYHVEDWDAEQMSSMEFVGRFGQTSDDPLPTFQCLLFRICRTWRCVALNTPTLFTRLSLSWRMANVNAFLQGAGTRLSLKLYIPHRLVNSNFTRRGQTIEDKAQFLKGLIARATEITISVASPLIEELPNGLDACAPLLDTLRVHQAWPARYRPDFLKARSLTRRELMNLQTQIFRETPPALENLELTSIDFTEEWLSCDSLRSVSVLFPVGESTMVFARNQFDPDVVNESPMLRDLSKLPNLENLHINEGRVERWRFPSVPVTLRMLRTLTLSEMNERTLLHLYSVLDLPALRQFNLSSFRCAPPPFGLPQDMVPWDCCWMQKLQAEASCLQMSLREEKKHSGLPTAGEIQLLGKSDDKDPLLCIAVCHHRIDWESKDARDVYVPVFQTILIHLRLQVSTIVLASPGPSKSLPNADILRSFFRLLRHVTSVTVQNCIADGLISGIHAAALQNAGLPMMEELILRDSTVDGNALSTYLRDHAASYSLTRVDLRGATLVLDEFDVVGEFSARIIR